MSGMDALCTVTWGAASPVSWECPGVRLTGRVELEPGEVVLLTFRVSTVFCIRDEDVQWRLRDTTPAMSSVMLPGDCLVTVSTHRVIWHRRLAELERASGHLRYEWLEKVFTYIEEDDDSKAWIIFTTTQSENAEKHLIKVFIPTPSDVADQVGRWIRRMAGDYKLARAAGLGVCDESLSDIRERMAQDSMDVVSAVGLPSAPLGWRLVNNRDVDRDPPDWLGAGSRAPQEFGKQAIVASSPPSALEKTVRARLDLVDLPDEKEKAEPPSEDRIVFNLAAIRANNDDSHHGLYPQITDGGKGLVAREDSDGQFEKQIPLRRITLIIPGKKEQLDLDGTLLLTQGRAAFVIPKFLRGRHYIGIGNLGVLLAGTTQTLSSARAAYKQRDKAIAGHVRYEWLKSVEVHHNNAMSSIVLAVEERVTSESIARPITVIATASDVSCALPALGKWVAQCAANVQRSQNKTLSEAQREALSRVIESSVDDLPDKVDLAGWVAIAIA